MHNEGFTQANPHQGEPVNDYDLRSRAVNKVRFLSVASNTAQLRGWMVESQIRMSGGGRMLCVRITTPDSAILNFSTDVPSGPGHSRTAISAQMSPDVGLIFRAKRTPAQDDLCVAALNRVVAAAFSLSPQASRDDARNIVECAAHNADPEQVRKFRADFIQRRSQLGPGYSLLPADVIVAFMASGWTPLRVAELYTSGMVPMVWVEVSPAWIRSITTTAVDATAMMDWAPGCKLRAICTAEMGLVRRYLDSGWSYTQMMEMARLSGMKGDPTTHIAKGWHYLPPSFALGGIKMGMSLAETHALHERGDVDEGALEMLAALGAGVQHA